MKNQKCKNYVIYENATGFYNSHIKQQFDLFWDFKKLTEKHMKIRKIQKKYGLPKILDVLTLKPETEPIKISFHINNLKTKFIYLLLNNTI